MKQMPEMLPPPDVKLHVSAYSDVVLRTLTVLQHTKVELSIESGVDELSVTMNSYDARRLAEQLIEFADAVDRYRRFMALYA